MNSAKKGAPTGTRQKILDKCTIFTKDGSLIELLSSRRYSQITFKKMAPGNKTTVLTLRVGRPEPIFVARWFYFGGVRHDAKHIPCVHSSEVDARCIDLHAIQNI